MMKSNNHYGTRIRAAVNRSSALLAPAAVVLTLSAFAYGSYASAQARRGGVRTASLRRQAPAQNQPIKFGDVTLSNYQTASGEFGKMLEARGPNTTVDVDDPKQPTAKTRLKATVLTAYMAAGGGNEVERVEAKGSLDVRSSRPYSKGGTQLIHFTGSKGIYYKSKNQVVISGPVAFDGQLIGKDGKTAQSVKGVADSAVYDEAAEVLDLDGGVTATVEHPSFVGPATIGGVSDLKLDLGASPMKFNITGGTVKFTPKENKETKSPKKEP